MLASLDGVTKRYARTEGLCDVTVQFPSGQVVGVLGLNGSGKSTLLKLLAGLLFPSVGEVAVFAGPPRQNRSQLVYLGEDDSLWSWMTPADAETFMKGLYDDFDIARYRSLLGDLAVPKRRTKAMSKGERGRLRLAMALARDAKLFLLDEPLAGIDLLSREKILQSLVREWHKDETILLSTHEIAEAEGLFDRVVYLREGRVALDVEAEDLRSRGRSVVNAFREVLT
jgi:ABC-2 type transport system ATP-binding protein